MTTLPVPGSQAPLLPPGKLVLRYLFGAKLASGQELFQTSDDVSMVVNGRNAFYDLLVQDENGQPIQDEAGRLIPRPDIELFQMDGMGFRYLVDLRDGHFEAAACTARGRFPEEKAPFYLAFPPPGAKLRLVYFRRRRHHTQVSIVVSEDLQPEITEALDSGQECEYHFGWITADGKHQATLILI